MSESRLCDKCIFTLLQLLSKEEILFLILLKKNSIINPQLSLNEKDLLDLVNANFDKEVSMYGLRKMLYRLTANNFITGQKFSSMKYYLNVNGLRGVAIYNAYVAKQLKANKEVNIVDASEEKPLIEESKENTTKKRSNRKRGK